MNRFEYGEKWVRNAGELLCSLLETTPICLTEKSGHSDIVTAYDKQLEQYLRGEILNAFPKDQIIGEEFPATGSGTDGCTWYIDPIDGTTNFVNQHSGFAICVGCTVPGGANFGYVLDVERQRLYSAQAGRGAWMNGQQIHTGRTAAVKDCLLTYPSVTDVFLSDTPYRAALTRLSLDVRAVRSLGSVALELCEVASGKMDLCIAIKSSPWDHNAARVILTEAGGAIQGLDGRPLSYTAPGSFLAGSSAELLAWVAEKYMIE